ncbi:MAG: hypothetical protein IKD69_00705 [Solobacterium sp.]|nr:hypothetical protein [Solobacterium sp.]
MKHIMHMTLAALMAVSTLTVPAKADGPVHLTCYLNGGTLMGKTDKVELTIPQNTEVGEVYPDLFPTVADPKAGFVGWSRDQGSSPDWYFDSFANYIPRQDETLYACYDEAYTVTLEYEKGWYEDEMSYTCKVPKGTYVNLSHIIPKAKDELLILAGWSAKEDSTTVGVPQSNLSYFYVDEDTTLYGVWKLKKTLHLVTGEGRFLLEDGYAFDEIDLAVPEGEECMVNVDMMGDDDRVFLGWSYAASSVEDLIPPYALPYAAFNDDTTLYAVWGDNKPVTELKKPADVTLKVGEYYELYYDVSPADHNRFMRDGYSCDSSVAVVGADIVIAEHPGQALIKLKAVNLDGSAAETSFTVTVIGDDPAACRIFGFCPYSGKDYWFENGRRQGVMGDPKNITDTLYGYERGREIYDPESDGWYWLDCIYDGAKAADKEVWMPYIFQSDLEAGLNKEGKWVRYNHAGKMIKGWYTVQGTDLALYPQQAGNTYYYDLLTGEMLKGWKEIEGKTYHFDEMSGILLG